MDDELPIEQEQNRYFVYLFDVIENRFYSTIIPSSLELVEMRDLLSTTYDTSLCRVIICEKYEDVKHQCVEVDGKIFFAMV